MPFWPAAVLLAGGGGQGYITPGAAFDTEPSDVVGSELECVSGGFCSLLFGNFSYRQFVRRRLGGMPGELRTA